MTDTTEKKETHTVYALDSFSKKDDEFKKDGFLFFLTEDKADAFWASCEKQNQPVKMTHYEKHGPVEVNSHAFNKINTNNQFFVRRLTMVQESK